MHCRAGGWYSVAISMFPVVVSTSIARASDMKSSYILYFMLCFTAMAVPSAWVLECFLLCTL